MPIRQIQSTFTLGELDPKLYARGDFEGYYKGAKRIRNGLVIPQGGVQRRFGQRRITRVRDSTANLDITDYTQVNGILYEFSVSENKSFLIIAHPEDQLGTPKVRFDIYLNGVLQTFIDTTDYTAAQIQELFFLPAQDSVLIFHPEVQPKRLLRNTDVNWTLNVLNFAIYPTFDYSFVDNVNYRTAADNYTPSATSGTGITVTSAIARFNAGHVGGLFIGNGGIMRITAVNSGGTVATGDTIVPFDATTAIKGELVIIQERAWGDFTGGTPAGQNRGWPSKATFFQRRLVVANTPTLRNTIWFSVSNDFLNFDDSEAEPLSAFALSIGSEQRESVQNLIGTKGFVALGTQGTYATSLFLDLPLTITNAFLNEQARDGSDGVLAQVVDNQIFFVDETKQLIKSAVYDIGSSSYNVLDATLLSSHIVNQPISSGTFKPQNNIGDIYLAVNIDGSLLAFQSVQSQNVLAWTLSQTRGKYRQIYSKSSQAYFLCERFISQAGQYFPPNAVYKSNSTFDDFESISAQVQSGVNNVAVLENPDDYLLFGQLSPFNELQFTIATPASQDVVFTVQYLDKFGNWLNIPNAVDNTNGLQNSGTFTWNNDDIPDWRQQDINKVLTGGAAIEPKETENGTDLFWVRFRRNNANAITAPVEQTIGLNNKIILTIEQADFDVYTDNTHLVTSNVGGAIANLEDLAGQQVYVTDQLGVPRGTYYVSQAGTIQTDIANQDVSVGVNYIPEIIPMPIVAQFAFAQSVYQPKHIKNIYIDYINSLGITVNGYELPSLSLNNFVLNQKPKPQTTFTEYTPMRGWDPRADNTISQELPLPMTVIGIGYIVEVS